VTSLSIESLSAYWSLPEVETNIVVFLNIFGALLLGLLVGYERSYHGRAAGMRTYGLVCMASAALTVVPGYPAYWYGGHVMAAIGADPTRVIQGIVTGVGFLGAGVIMKEGFNISGLTTAASIWASSAIGILVGVGFYASAMLLALLSAVCMMWVSRLEGWLPSRQAVAIVLRFRKGFTPHENVLRAAALNRGYEIAGGSLSISYRSGQPEWQFVAVALTKDAGAPISELAAELTGFEGVEDFQLSHARN
jgi:putative Mg2+ transporter-C (MgtC) family protein